MATTNSRAARRKKNSSTSTPKDQEYVLTQEDLDNAPITPCKTVAEGYMIKGFAPTIYYTRISLDEIKEGLTELDDLEGEEKIERTIDLVENHWVDQSGKQMRTREQLGALPIDLVIAVANAIIKGRSIEDEKNA